MNLLDDDKNELPREGNELIKDFIDKQKKGKTKKSDSPKGAEKSNGEGESDVEDEKGPKKD